MQYMALKFARDASQMSGTEVVGTAADQSEMEAQSAAVEEMNQKAHDIGLKVDSVLFCGGW
jgi:hypothetical protein